MLQVGWYDAYYINSLISNLFNVLARTALLADIRGSSYHPAVPHLSLAAVGICTRRMSSFFVIFAMQVLAVGLRFIVVTDSELRAAMETTETKSTTLCRPNGVLAKFVGFRLGCFLHFDSLYRTFLGAQTATDTNFLIYCKELRLTLVRQQRIGHYAEEIRHS